MWRTDPVEPGHPAAHPTDHPVLRVLTQGAIVELLWGVGLLVVLGLVSLMIWALLNTLGTI